MRNDARFSNKISFKVVLKKLGPGVQGALDCPQMINKILHMCLQCFFFLLMQQEDWAVRTEKQAG